MTNVPDILIHQTSLARTRACTCRHNAKVFLLVILLSTFATVTKTPTVVLMQAAPELESHVLNPLSQQRAHAGMGDMLAAAAATAGDDVSDDGLPTINFPLERLVEELVGELSVAKPGRNLAGNLALHKYAKKLAAGLLGLYSAPGFANLPFQVMCEAALLFNQVSKMAEAEDAVLVLAINTAILLEIFSGLTTGGGFSDAANRDYWTKTTGILHLVMLKRVCVCAWACVSQLILLLIVPY